MLAKSSFGQLRRCRVTVALVVFLSLGNPVLGWSETGHHVIAVLAWEMLSSEERERLSELLVSHPQASDRFATSDSLREDRGAVERWRIGLAACWPDTLGDSSYARPKWHYEFGASLVVGAVDAASRSTKAPAEARMSNTDLHALQAIEVCSRVLSQPDRPQSQRAVALCWLLHLIADIHQPCHAGSLYAPALPDGDRGGNLIRFRDGGNLHAAWDRLLGARAEASDVRRRVLEFGELRSWAESQASSDATWLEPETWWRESIELSRTHVYTADVLEPVVAASRGLVQEIPGLALDASYFRSAGGIARRRAREAAARTFLVLRTCLQESDS